MSRVIGLFSNPLMTEEIKQRSWIGRSLALFRRAFVFKANPREQKYMRQLFSEFYPAGIFLDADMDQSWRDKLSSKDSIVLLYPDSLGHGFQKIEAFLAQNSYYRKSEVYVLNGRRRLFRLTKKYRLKIILRRLFERTMMTEFLLIPIFILVTPCLLIYDFIRGRL